MFSFIFLLVMTAVTFVLSEVLRPKPNIQNAKLAHLGDFQFPTATQGRVVPIVWGTVQLNGPNVIWYGKLKPVAMTQKIKTGLFSSKKQTTGYRYYVGMQMALCRGEIDEVKTIWIGSKVAWQGSVKNGIISINQPHLFGGVVSGTGGVIGNLNMFSGNATQLPDPYLAQTPSNFLWFDDFSVGQSAQGLHRYLNATPGIYYWVGNAGTGNAFGPAASLISDLAEPLVTNQGSGTTNHILNKEVNSLPNGDLNVYTALLQHPDRIRLPDKLKIFMTFRPMSTGVIGGAHPTSNVFLGMGCKCQDLLPVADNYGIYVTCHDQTGIKVWLSTPTTGGMTQIANLSSPGNFAQLGSNTQTLELHVSGNNLTLLLNGGNIWSGSDTRVAEIPGDHQGFNLIVSGNANTNFNNLATDWSYVGIYNFGIDQLNRPITVDVPAYRGTCHGVWEGGYLGTSTQIQPWAFEVRRTPNGLALTSGEHIVNNADANPMNVIYEILTDPDWGLGFLSTDIDLTGFAAAAHTLFTEGNGWSAVLDTTKQAIDVVQNVAQQVDGVLYINRQTGLWTMKLARNDYSVGSVPLINETNLIKIKSFSRGAWAETTNNVRVAIVNRDNNYQPDYGIAQDMANVRIQNGAVVTTEETYPGVKDKTLANNIAWRDLRMLAYPIAKAQLVVDRTLTNVNTGDVVAWTDASLGITLLPMRVGRVDYGRLEDGEITIDVVQDVFAFQPPSFADPQTTSWQLPSAAIPADAPSTDRYIIEAPTALCRIAEENPGVLDRIWCGARQPTEDSTRFDIWCADGANDYTASGVSEDFLVAGSLLTPITASDTQGFSTITVNMDLGDDAATLLLKMSNASPSDIGTKLFNIVAIGNEFLAFQDVVDNLDGTVTLSFGYRGVMDTVPATHALNTRVWFLGAGGNLTTDFFPPTDTIGVKLLTEGTGGILDIGIAVPSTVVMNNRAIRPYPPTNLDVGGTLWASTASIDSGLTVDFVRRDWRTANEVAALTDETSLPSDFPTANTTQYSVDIYDDPQRINTLSYSSPYSSANSISISRTHLLRKVLDVIVPTNATSITSYTFNAGTGANLPADFAVYYYHTTGQANDLGDTADASGIKQTANGLAQADAFAAKSVTAYLTAFPTPVSKRSIKASVQISFTNQTDILLYDRADYTGLTNSGVVLRLFPFAAGPNQLNVQLSSLLSGVRTSYFNINNPIALPSDPMTVAVEIQIDDATNHYEVFLNSTSVGTATISALAGTGCTGFGAASSLGATAGGVFSYSLFDCSGGFSSTPAYVFPSKLRASVNTRHTVAGTVYSALQNLTWDFSVTSTLSSLLILSNMPYNTPSTLTYTAAATGTFSLTIDSAIGGDVQVSVNGGAYATVIAAGGTTGTFAATSGQTINVKHLQNSSTGADVMVTVKNPSAVAVAFGILTY